MRIRGLGKNWSIGAKTTASHMLVAFVSIVLAMVLCYLFGYQYTRTVVIRELRRQVTVIAEKERGYDVVERASRKSVVEAYQDMTNSAVFFIDYEGEAVHLRRFTPRPAEPGMPDTEEDFMADYSYIELFDSIDKHFIDRILAGETVTAMQRFQFADGVVVFAGAPIDDTSEKVAGGVILAQPVSIISAISREMGQVLFIPACISIALAALMAMYLTRMLVRPILHITRVARRLTEGDYDLRVDVKTGDEIGELGDTLNLMSAKLTEVIRSLREERDRLELVIGSIGEGILAVDHEMQLVHCNRAFLGLMEMESIQELKSDGREDVRTLKNVLKQTAGGEGPLRVTFANPSGRAIQAELSPMEDAGGGRFGVVCLLSDVSEAQRLEQLRRDYVANVSHELRTPLTGIRGMIEPLIDGCMETEEERQGCYQIIQKETMRLEKLVGEMLDMSRLQDGRVVVELERLELPGILGASVQNMLPLAREAGVELKLELPDARLECCGNEARIAQVLVILLDNAIDFTPRGGTVTVFAHESAKHVTVGVRDTGCGIEPKDLPFIWERFYKADRSRMRTKGTGLGLAIARLVVQLMGGEIGVVSEPGKGAEFTFTLKKDAS